jgi:hypothetical protein
MGDWYAEDEEPIEPFTDVTTLTGRQLNQAMYDVDDERKDLSRYVRRHQGGVWTKDDEHMMENMNKWARMVMDEIIKRSKEPEEPAENLNPKASEKQEPALGDKESLSSTSNQSTSR